MLGTGNMTHPTTGHLALLGTTAMTGSTGHLARLGVAAVVTDMDLLGATGVIGDIEIVSDNISDVNNFADQYQIDNFSPSAPTTDGGGNALADGDLAFDSTANRMKVYDGTSFTLMGLSTAEVQVEANNSAVAMSIALG